jgi:hypothetical protein
VAARRDLPHVRGKWWNQCGCGTYFADRAGVKFCPEHRSSKMTLSERKRILSGLPS